jgi:ERCC4-related helicase
MLINFLPKTNFEILDQIIVFVDQRLIADLLYKSIVIHVKEKKDKSILGVVYSHSNKNIMNKIVKKLSPNEEEEGFKDIFSEILDMEVSQNMSLESQKSILNSFRKEECKVLISTNVIEEGLDIPSCNQIIVYDKIVTPKTFIQMSGRARKRNSKIYFMCDQKETKEIKESKFEL